MSSSCSNCNEPIDAPNPDIVTCAHCGAVQYTRPDIDEFAAAIVQGRTDVASPSAIAGVKVRFEAAAAAGYRSAGSTDRSRGDLTLRARRWSAQSVIRLLGVAAVVAGLGYGVVLAWRADVYLPLALAAVPGLIYVAVRLTTELDSMRIVVANGKLLVRPYERVPGAVLLAADKVVRLFVAPHKGAYALFARTETKPQPQRLLRGIRRPEIGWYLARQVEHGLGIADRSAPRDAAQPDPPAKLLTSLWGKLLRWVFIPIVVGTPIVGLWLLGAQLAELDVQDDRQERGLDARQAGPVYVTVDVAFAETEYMSLDDVPRSLQIRVQLLRQGKLVQDLSCDPFRVTEWWDHHSNYEGTKRGRYLSFWGPMHGCGATLPAAGRFTLRAWREWKPDMPRIGLEETTIAVRQGTGALTAGRLRTLLLIYGLSWPLMVFIPFPIWLVTRLAAISRRRRG